jgi:hypothetical protein
MRPRISWLIGAAVAVLLVVAGADALRSASNKTAAPTASTDFSGPTTTPIGIPTGTSWGKSARIRQYVVGARAICARAMSDFHAAAGAFPGAGLEEIAAWNTAAARAAENSLTNLRALPSPESDQALINEFFSAAEEEIDALRLTAAAASAGQRRRASVLVGEQIDAIHRKDARADRLSARWRVDNLDILRACPLSLPA